MGQPRYSILGELQTAGIGVSVFPHTFQGVPIYPPIDSEVVMIAPAPLPPLGDGYVFQRGQAQLFPQALYPPDVIAQVAGRFLVASRLLPPVGQVDFQVLRCEIGVCHAG